MNRDFGEVTVRVGDVEVKGGFTEVDYAGLPPPNPDANRYRASATMQGDPEDVARIGLAALPPLTVEMARRLLIARGIEHPTAVQIFELANEYIARAVASPAADFRAPETRQQRRARERATAKAADRQPTPKKKRRARERATAKAADRQPTPKKKRRARSVRRAAAKKRAREERKAKVHFVADEAAR
jgi:hypothetical protein